jgi:hypothetical protein
VLEEGTFPAGLNLGNPLHSFDSRLYQLAVVADRNISSFLKVDGRVLESYELHAKDGTDDCIRQSFPCLPPS